MATVLISGIPKFPDYKISQDGKVYSVRYGRFLKPRFDSKGYSQIVLRKNNESYSRRIHRLMLETFHGPCPDGMECCHNDGNPKNNALSNLRWDTHSNNVKDAFKHKGSRKGEKGPNAKLNELQVRIIRRLLEFGKLFQWEIASIFNVQQYAISNINCGKTWKRSV